MQARFASEEALVPQEASKRPAIATPVSIDVVPKYRRRVALFVRHSFVICPGYW
ncbi:hypothetical protein FEAC_25100 [Ferrimicrobium acidiphilum DSM 19497]|uniref:Uncharacterized protein n=1 Tax=Ferrimicrobium acidiphilum DSM 19497 TaxID=1121877 RepID=A0A0D8FR38_9ACTN|nr:hypothetical protein FEAC_25100 [Ferrimicrobium acidiphilum DSM 19497]